MLSFLHLGESDVQPGIGARDIVVSLSLETPGAGSGLGK